MTECEEIIIVTDIVSTKKTNTIATKKANAIATNVTSTASTNCQSKKVRDCYILRIVLLVIFITCYYFDDIIKLEDFYINNIFMTKIVKVKK